VLDGTSRTVVVMMMTMAMTMVRVSMISDGLSVGFVTMLMALLFLFMAVAMRMRASMTMVVFFSKMSMLMEESHTNNINDESNDSYDDHLTRMDDRRIVDSLKGFNEDIETDEYEEDSVDQAGKGLESIESIGEFTVGRESCLVRCVYTYCEGCGVEKHVG